MSIRDAIADLGVKVKQGKKEEEQDYLKRVFAALSEEFSDDPKDKKWKAFGTEAQEWYNSASEAADNEDDLPHFEAADDEGDEDEAPKGKKAKGNGKVKGKRAKAAEADEDEADEDEPKSKKGKGKAAKAVKGKAKKGGNGASRRSPPAFENDQVIKVLNKDAHNEGSDIRARFKKIKTGMTVGQARKAGLSMLDLKCDVQRGNLQIK